MNEYRDFRHLTEGGGMAAANARLADLHDAARCRNVVPRRSFSVRSRMAATLRRTANRIEPCVTQPCGSAGRAA